MLADTREGCPHKLCVVDDPCTVSLLPKKGASAAPFQGQPMYFSVHITTRQNGLTAGHRAPIPTAGTRRPGWFRW